MTTGSPKMALYDLVREMAEEVGHFSVPDGSYLLTHINVEKQVRMKINDDPHGYNGSGKYYDIYTDELANTATISVGGFPPFDFKNPDSVILFKAALMQVRVLISLRAVSEELTELTKTLPKPF